MSNIRKLQFLNYFTSAASYIGEVGSLFFDPTTTTLRIGDGTTPGGNIIDGGSSSLPIIDVTYCDESETANDAVGGIPGASIAWYTSGAADVLYTVTSGTTVTATGAAYFWNGIPGTAAGAAGTGANGVRFLVGDDMNAFVALVYATNASGTAYAAPATGNSRVQCLAAGTSIALSDGTYKLIEDITYEDALLVWDFDNRCFAKSRPLWIKQGKTAKAFNVLAFSDDSYLHTVGQHRIFNKQAGCFTYPLTDETPVGTTSFNQYGQEVTLVEKGVINVETVAYNVISDYHMNLFANGILTSTSFNNVYPIENMKFVKDGRAMRRDAFGSIPDRFYYGMRLWEQTRDEAAIERYIQRMIATESLNTLVEA